MKKRLAMLCMLTCLLGLTACGTETVLTQAEQERGERAANMAAIVVTYMIDFFDDATAVQYQDNYNVHELEALAEAELAERIYILSMIGGVQFDFDSIDVEGNAILNGINSFNSAHASLGDIDTSGAFTATYEISGDTIIVTVPLTGTLTDKNGKPKTAKVEILFSNDIFLTVESCTLNMDQTVGALMIKAASDTLMGMGTVFSVLILISLLIACFGYIPKLQAKFSGKKEAAPKEEKREEKTSPAKAADTTIVQTAQTEDVSDDLELAAVIAAAIAAYEGTVSVDGFVVRSIRKRR